MSTRPSPRSLPRAGLAALAVCVLAAVLCVGRDMPAGAQQSGAGAPPAPSGDAASAKPGKAGDTAKNAEDKEAGPVDAKPGSGDAKGGKGAQRPVPVTEAVAAVKSLPVEIRAIGTVESSATVGIKSRVGGELVKVHIREGQDVKKGEPLFSIDPRPLESSLHEAQAALERNRALLAKAQEDNRRYGELMQQNIISREQYEQVTSNVAALKAQVRGNEAAVESARLQLEYASIRSPIAGRTGRLLVDEGNMVKANADDPMLVIERVTPIEVAFAVPESHLPAVMDGMKDCRPPVEAAVPGAEKSPEKGSLVFVDNTVDTRTGTIGLKAEFENKDRRLWPGQFVNVVLRLGAGQAVTVPSQAVQAGVEGLYAFVIGADSKVSMRPVVTGRSVGGETEIVSGLAAGERVVTDGQMRLVPGSLVEVKGRNAGGKPAEGAACPPEGPAGKDAARNADKPAANGAGGAAQ